MIKPPPTCTNADLIACRRDGAELWFHIGLRKTWMTVRVCRRGDVITDVHWKLDQKRFGRGFDAWQLRDRNLYEWVKVELSKLDETFLFGRLNAHPSLHWEYERKMKEKIERVKMEKIKLERSGYGGRF